MSEPVRWLGTGDTICSAALVDGRAAAVDGEGVPRACALPHPAPRTVTATVRLAISAAVRPGRLGAQSRAFTARAYDRSDQRRSTGDRRERMTAATRNMSEKASEAMSEKASEKASETISPVGAIA